MKHGLFVDDACRSCGAKWRQGVGEKDYPPIKFNMADFHGYVMLCDLNWQQDDFIYDVLTSPLIASKMVYYSKCPKLLHQLAAVGSSQDFLLIFLTVGHHFLVFFFLSLTVAQSRHSFIYPLVTFIFLIATALSRSWPTDVSRSFPSTMGSSNATSSASWSGLFPSSTWDVTRGMRDFC